jgi:hypothetical protein
MSYFAKIRLSAFSVLLLSSLLAVAQGPTFPTVEFTQEWWSLNPPQYKIRVDKIGNAHYHSTPNSTEQNGEPYELDFNLSNATRDKIFNDLQTLNFLATPIADVPGDSGTHTIVYAYMETLHSASYHGTSNATAKQLTAVFQGISDTLETARRIDKAHKSKDPALADEMTRMLARAKAGELVELQLAVPVLQSITGDTSVSADIRSQAQTVLKMATATAPV